jgi:site-specific DNA-methyltransferase (adenine-specific)
MINQFKGNRSDHWATPKNIYDQHIGNGYIDYNPLNSYIDPFYKNTYKYENQNIFINPPFSILNKPEWIITIKKLLLNKNHIKILMPARVDTKQFHTLLDMGFKVKFIKGRLKYNDSKPAPFPSLWLIYGEKI